MSITEIHYEMLYSNAMHIVKHGIPKYLRNKSRLQGHSGLSMVSAHTSLNATMTATSPMLDRLKKQNDALALKKLKLKKKK